MLVTILSYLALAASIIVAAAVGVPPSHHRFQRWLASEVGRLNADPVHGPIIRAIESGDMTIDQAMIAYRN